MKLRTNKNALQIIADFSHVSKMDDEMFEELADDNPTIDIYNYTSQELLDFVSENGFSVYPVGASVVGTITDIAISGLIVYGHIHWNVPKDAQFKTGLLLQVLSDDDSITPLRIYGAHVAV